MFHDLMYALQGDSGSPLMYGIDRPWELVGELDQSIMKTLADKTTNQVCLSWTTAYRIPKQTRFPIKYAVVGTNHTEYPNRQGYQSSVPWLDHNIPDTKAHNTTHQVCRR